MSVGIFSALLLLSLSISPFLQAEEISHSGEKCTAAELGLLAGGRLAVSAFFQPTVNEVANNAWRFVHSGKKFSTLGVRDSGETPARNSLTGVSFECDVIFGLMCVL